MKPEELYRGLKSLQKYPEWVTFVAHIKSVSLVHSDSCVGYSAKGKDIDAHRQAWISEGLIEAIEEPERIVKSYEYSAKGIYQKACQLCGHIFDKVKI